MNKSIQLRDYVLEDARDLANIYYNTIHKINIRDYNQQQVDVWAPKSSLELEGWMKKWEKLKPIVAVINNKIVGFAEFNNQTGYIDCFYCHHDYIGVGVGTSLMKAIDAKAKSNNIRRIYADVSITAKPFFEAKSFSLVKEQIIDRQGVKLKNYVMEKHLS